MDSIPEPNTEVDVETLTKIWIYFLEKYGYEILEEMEQEEKQEQ